MSLRLRRHGDGVASESFASFQVTFLFIGQCSHFTVRYLSNYQYHKPNNENDESAQQPAHERPREGKHYATADQPEEYDGQGDYEEPR